MYFSAACQDTIIKNCVVIFFQFGPLVCYYPYFLMFLSSPNEHAFSLFTWHVKYNFGGET